MAEEFDLWLSDEYWRHDRCVMEACDQITKRPLIAEILNNSITRHQEELEGIIKTRERLKELFGL